PASGARHAISVRNQRQAGGDMKASAHSHDFRSLSIRDLLDAREAYHIHLAHLDNVYATAIGRYLIRDDDKNAKDPQHRSNRKDLGPRTLANWWPREWSWPCILVFVDSWCAQEELARDPAKADSIVPSRLYLPDGRVVPTCVVEVRTDTGPPAFAQPQAFPS